MIFSTDVAAMEQWRRDFNFQWYEMGVDANLRLPQSQAPPGRPMH